MRKKVYLIVLSAFFTLNAVGQDTSYFDNNGVRVSSLAASDFYQINRPIRDGTTKEAIITYYKSGQLRSEGQYSDTGGAVGEGHYKLYYPDGRLHQDIVYKSGKFNGPLLTYWENGKPKRIDNYRNGIFVSGECFDSLGRTTVHTVFEEMPVFPGGESGLMQFLKEEIRYPNKARKKGIQGKVVIGFVVNANGSVSHVKIVESANEELDKEAERVVQKMPRWKPGKHDGKDVNVYYELPVQFRLQ